ncbi:MAG TPA: chloride channel protein, partial [Cyclobacteriaceae bacterium]|nr:chloride channel protein [Cyclobacteriaceae bacterium]
EQLFKGSPLSDLMANNERWILGISILLVGIVKVFAVSFTLSAGGNGGNFAPSLLVGACLGFSFAFLNNTLGLSNLPTSNFCLVAMAGVLTGIFHSPLTAIFLIAEITGGYELMIPLMIVSALSTAVSKYLSPYSLDEAKLYQNPGSQPLTKDLHILSQLSLDVFVEKDFVPVKLGSSLRALTDAVSHSKRNIYPIVDADGNLHGIIALEDIREIMFNTNLYDSISVNQLMQKPRVTSNIDEDMNVIMEKFDKSGVWNIPVLDKGKYVGFVSKSRVFTNYRERLR